MASAPIRSQAEINAIINKAQHSLADLGLSIVEDAQIGASLEDIDFRDKVYRLILLRAYLKNILDPNTGLTKLYYTTSTNEKKYNDLLDALVELSGNASSVQIPLIIGRRGTVVYYPSSSGSSSGGSSSSGGPATPGGVTFQNLNVTSPGEVVDSLDASASDYAFYIISIRGTGSGEGSRIDMMGVQWRNAETPVIAEWRGGDVGGSTAGVTFTAALNAGQIDLTANVPTDGWVIKGTRISFENISFQNAQGPLPTGGTTGQYLRKSSSTPYDAAWADIAIGEIAGLVTALANKLNLAGGSMTGDIDMGGNTIGGLPNPPNADSAANKNYVDQLFALLDDEKLDKSGDTMSGDLNMGSNQIKALALATEDGDAANKGYVDGVATTLQGNIDAAQGLAIAAQNTADSLIPTVVEVGGLNLETSGPTVSTPHGLSGAQFIKIATIQLRIRNDANDFFYFSSNTLLSITSIDATNINWSFSPAIASGNTSTAFSRGRFTITFDQ
jgi:hypothetical protein